MNGKEALFLPGSKKEFFSSKRYCEEIGKEFNKIVLYLCTRSDCDTSKASHSSWSPRPSTGTGTVRTLQTFFNADNEPDNFLEESDQIPSKCVKWVSECTVNSSKLEISK